MFFYGESIESMLKQQNLEAFIEKAALNSHDSKAVPSPLLAQMVTSTFISDGVLDFPCQFTCQAFRTGSYLRITRWEIDLHKGQIVVHEAQYLGGAGCQVKHGKKWDLQKLKSIQGSKGYSKHMTTLFVNDGKVGEPAATEFRELGYEMVRQLCERSVADQLPSKRKMLLNGQKMSLE